MTIKGALVAATVAGLFSASASLAKAADEKEGEVLCSGINACKGQGACASKGHGCAGKNGCKGEGLSKTTKAECKAKGGKEVKAPKEKK
jgi:hypothetical protein